MTRLMVSRNANATPVARRADERLRVIRHPAHDPYAAETTASPPIRSRTCAAISKLRNRAA
jgi:hypothetical protein